MTSRTFYSWRMAPARSMATGNAPSGRLLGAAPMEVADLDDPSQKGDGKGAFELLGPAEVSRLSPGTITRRFPTPGVIDAEAAMAPLVELSAPDLPWRYTPELPDPQQNLRPWLVLVCAPVGPDGLTLTPDGRVTIGQVAQASHPLSQSWRWAHVHDLDGTGTKLVARILSPGKLQKGTEHLACLAPSFILRGAAYHDAWNGSAPVTIACYDSWTFRTGELGDFPQLATLLHPARAAELPADFGRGTLRYHFRGAAAADATLSADGALTRVPVVGEPDPAATPLDASVTNDMAPLTGDVTAPDGRPVVTAPRYHAAFTPPGTAPTAPGWTGELATDPRGRGAAGLGAWAAISWAERIAAAAVSKAGDLATARDRVGQLALGLEASRSLWRRRLPADPVARLGVLAPVLGRLPAAAGGTALDVITGRVPLLQRALWSSAARRALRVGPARTAWAAPGASLFPTILGAANRCPPPVSDPATIPAGDVDPARRAGAVKAAVAAAGRANPAQAAAATSRLDQQGSPTIATLAAVLAALDPGGGRPPDSQALSRVFDGPPPPPVDPADLAATTAQLAALSPPAPPCRPLDLGELARVVAAAVDPTPDRPVVVDRVLGTLPGLTSIGPVEVSPELDLPLWTFLRDNAPDWLLPGVGDLAEHEVVGLATDPAFVEAFLVGANTQALGELRWRNLPVAARWSPLRKFWQRANGAMDVLPVSTWPVASPLGDPSLQPDGVGAEAVVVFKTPLFRRYPHTVVYLYESQGSWLAPSGALDPARRHDPTFTGNLADDLVFFGFDVPAADLAKSWVVLEEPPSGYRFYRENPTSPNPNDQVQAANDFQNAAAAPNSAAYAYDTFAVPIRVMIGELVQ